MQEGISPFCTLFFVHMVVEVLSESGSSEWLEPVVPMTDMELETDPEITEAGVN